MIFVWPIMVTSACMGNGSNKGILSEIFSYFLYFVCSETIV